METWDTCSKRLAPARFSCSTTPVTPLALPLKKLGYSYNTTDEAQIQEAVDLLIEQKPLVQATSWTRFSTSWRAARRPSAPYYSGDFFTMQESNPDLACACPRRAPTSTWTPCASPRAREQDECRGVHQLHVHH